MILATNPPNDHDHDHDHDHPNPNKDLLAEAYSLLKSNKPISVSHGTHSNTPFTSVRQINYKNHDIVIQTRYEILIDGKLVNNQIHVDNEGKVSSHAMPTYSFPSTIDLIKKLIDKFPNSFGPEATRKDMN